MCVYIMAYYKLLKKHYIINIYSYFMCMPPPCFRCLLLLKVQYSERQNLIWITKKVS